MITVHKLELSKTKAKNNLLYKHKDIQLKKEIKSHIKNFRAKLKPKEFQLNK